MPSVPAKRKRTEAQRRERKGKIVGGKNPTNGQFLPGNQWWLARSSQGPKPLFEKAEDLWAACLEYFAFVQNNPLQEEKVFHKDGEITHTFVSKMRAMTLDGLCIFLDTYYRTWVDWRKDRPDLAHVLAQVEAVIRDQKFTGAACDLLNASLISRDLGLADRQDWTSSDGSMTPKVAVGMTPKEAMQAYQEMVRGGK